MSWGEFMAARQLLAEERVGTKLRAAESLEDAQFNQSRKALRG